MCEICKLISTKEGIEECAETGKRLTGVLQGHWPKPTNALVYSLLSSAILLARYLGWDLFTILKLIGIIGGET